MEKRIDSISDQVASKFAASNHKARNDLDEIIDRSHEPKEGDIEKAIEAIRIVARYENQNIQTIILDFTMQCSTLVKIYNMAKEIDAWHAEFDPLLNERTNLLTTSQSDYKEKKFDHATDATRDRRIGELEVITKNASSKLNFLRGQLDAAKNAYPSVMSHLPRHGINLANY